MNPYRSVLYMPGSNARALEKARSLAADALILDLEDAVAPDAKDAARDLVCAAIAEGFGARKVLLRVNGADTPWGSADLEAAIAARPDGILLPKVNGPADIARVAAAMGADHPSTLWAMIETPRGVLNALAIAEAPGMEGVVLGTNDLVKDLGARPGPDRAALVPALAQTLLAARACGLVCLDGVYNAFKDEAGLRAEAEQGRSLGFDGKTLIHPAQIAIANEVFGPTEAEIAESKEIADAYEAAREQGKGVAVLNGRIVENLHVETARATLAKADAIARLSAQSKG
ncbi:HpcH/HpaI aldolase/citrate lyase family protein [Oceanibium sediminis]|uniref:HpcH/HpaI aldolase/citrate lyase family protein n=1 Tax=Oceanibium sediminis TaxID=2026339 RepID=UPI000DD30B73|nr:CoA ester lyase [Oceanibium sediminis]